MTRVNFAMTTLLNEICAGALLAAAMWLFLKLLPRLNPTTRFTVLWMTLLAIVALPLKPVLSPLVSSIMRTAFAPVPYCHGTQADSPAIQAVVTSAAAMTASTQQEGLESPPRRSDRSSTINRVTAPQALLEPIANPSLQPRQNTPQIASNPSSIEIHPLIRIHSAKVPHTLEILWALLSSFLLLRLGLGYHKLRRLKAEAKPAHQQWQLRLTTLCEINHVHRQARLLVSSRIAAPISLGFLHPAILIPQRLLDTLSDSELEHVVLHELGHLRRWDDWTNLAQKLIEALLPIQPAVYWIARRMSIEREMACDDWVIAATGTPESYASSLTRVAELSQWAKAGMLAAGATGSRSQLFSRVHHMLDRTRNAAPKLAIAPLGAAIAAVAVLIYAGIRAPQLIAFAQTSTSESAQPKQIPAPQPASIEPVKSPQPSVAAPMPEMQSVSSTPQPLIASPSSLSSTATPPSPILIASNTSLDPAAPPESIALPATPQTSESNSHTEINIHDGWKSLSIKIDGAIEFTDNDRDVKSLSPCGHFRIVDGKWLSSRTYDVKADASGNLTRTYSVGTSTKPLDAEGQAWLAELLPQMIRDTGIGAGPRIARFLRQGGPQAVLNEIGLIHSDGSKRVYIEQLSSQATLNADQLRETAKVIRGISSDGDKAQVLIHVDERYFTGNLRPSLFEAAASIHSDGDKRRVLTDVVHKDGDNVDTLLSVAATAKHISSDGDKSAVLIEMANAYREKDGLGMAYFDAVKSISSDGDHAHVLLTMLSAHGENRETLSRVLTSAEKISSSGDKAHVLKEAVARYNDDEFNRKAFLDAANSISSDGDHQQVLIALAHRPGISALTVGGIAKSSQRIFSDGDKARVLGELVATNIEPVRDDFFTAVDSIHSDGDHGHVLSILLDKPGNSTATVVAAIQSATHISSDGDKARVFKDAARRYSNDPATAAALRKAVGSLHSDGDYRSVMSELMQREQSQ